MGKTNRAATVGVERELEWYFCCAGEVMGLHGASLESSGGTIWDARALERLHVSRLDHGRRRDIERVQRVRAVLAELTAEAVAIITAAFTPRPWDAALRSASGRAGEYGTLAGLVVTGDEAHKAFVERRKREPRDGTEVARHLAEFARTEARARVFAPLVRAARRRLDGALAAYVAVRDGHAQAAKTRRDAYYAELRAGLL
jgi:hypothetical protein